MGEATKTAGAGRKVLVVLGAIIGGLLVGAAVDEYVNGPRARPSPTDEVAPSPSSNAAGPNAAVLDKLDAQCSESRTRIDAQADVVRKALLDDFGKRVSKADVLEEMQKATVDFTGNRECADIFATLIVMLGQQ